MKPNDSGSVKFGESYFEFHHARSFEDTYHEIFEQEIYHFIADNNNPYIIDCGANMGLSVLYFSKKYPNANIIAFEPEEAIYNVLRKNVSNYTLSNVRLEKKAVWDEKTTLQFFTDNGMGGSVTNAFENQKPATVETTILRDYLTQKVDFLKIDIEGAEYRVLKHCADRLHLVENLFVEYHSFINEEQHLDDILQLLKANGFRYHIKESFSRRRPFAESTLACENMEMAVNIFAYKYKQKVAVKSTNQPLVSICIPVYNGDTYLAESIECALAQTYSNIEIIITDDGSTDNSVSIAKQYASKYPHIVYHRNPENAGLVGNWKICVEKASGEWIKYLFQDDRMKPDCVEKMMQACMEYDTKFALCSRDFLIEESTDVRLKHIFLNEIKKTETIFSRKKYYSPAESAAIVSQYLVENVLGEPICTIFHKSVYDAVNGFDDSVKQIVDYEFVMKVILNHPFVFLSEKLVSFRVHGESTTTKNTLKGKNIISDRIIHTTIGDFLVLMEAYLKKPLLKPILQKWGSENLINYQKYIYLRACKYVGTRRINKVLGEFIRSSDHLKNLHYNWFRYKKYKRYFKNNIKDKMKA